VGAADGRARARVMPRVPVSTRAGGVCFVVVACLGCAFGCVSDWFLRWRRGFVSVSQRPNQRPTTPPPTQHPPNHTPHPNHNAPAPSCLRTPRSFRTSATRRPRRS
jgi:hypothetical protein